MEKNFKTQENINNVYCDLLNLFKSPYDSFRKWQSTPFLIGDKVYATDSRVIIFFDKNLLNKDAVAYPLGVLESSIVVKSIPEKKDKVSIKTSELKKSFDDNDGYGNKICNSCKGESVVYFKYEYDGEYFEKLDICPICNGDGFIENRYNIFFDIFGFRFDAHSIGRIIETAIKLNQDIINILNIDNRMLFEIGNVNVVANSLYKQTKNDKLVVFNINK